MIRRIIFPGLLLMLMGCGHATETHEHHAGHATSMKAAPDSAPSSSATSKPGHEGHDTHNAHNEHASHGGTLTLAVVMSQLGRDMNGVSAGVWSEDFDLLARSAHAIADHPHVSGEEIKRIQGILGDDFPQFIAHDKQVHDAASRLHKSASAHDMPGALKELSTLQTGCVSCHTSFRQRLRANNK